MSSQLRGATGPRYRLGAARASSSSGGDPNEHARLATAVAELCAERGHANFRTADILARAAVPRSAFCRHYETKDDCLLGAHAHYSAILLAEVGSALDSSPSRPEALRRAVRALLEFGVERPEGAYLLCFGVLAGGEEGARRYRSTIDALADRLQTNRDPGEDWLEKPTMAAAVFLAPLIDGSLRSAGEDELSSLESTLVGLLTDLARRPTNPGARVGSRELPREPDLPG